MDFVDVNEGNARWVQDFRLKAYASPAKLESIDGARYHALLIPSCPGALADLASSGSLARILQHFRSENKPICAVGHGVAALCCATNEDRSWVFQGYSVTGPSVYELVRAPGFARLPLIVEDFVKDAGAIFSGEPGLGRHRPGATAETQAGFLVLGGPLRGKGAGLCLACEPACSPRFRDVLQPVSRTPCTWCWTATWSQARMPAPLSQPCTTCSFSAVAGSEMASHLPADTAPSRRPDSSGLQGPRLHDSLRVTSGRPAGLSGIVGGL
ncbi:glutamine amidotransferase-like class 1 domain-containing protein 1 isoform X2 [Neovison vison]|nr:glutamine amidotransferase-like class 1 domain-containing protein 1 isoform X2 [Neogale vison]